MKRSRNSVGDPCSKNMTKEFMVYTTGRSRLEVEFGLRIFFAEAIGVDCPKCQYMSTGYTHERQRLRMPVFCAGIGSLAFVVKGTSMYDALMLRVTWM